MTQTDSKARGIEFFTSDVQVAPPPDPDASWFKAVYRAEGDKEVFEAAAPTVFANQAQAFIGFPDMPLNLIVQDFNPNFVLPQHSHDEDCVYYVIRGQAIMGQRTLEPGDGFLVRAGRPYAYSAGPEGVRVLEIRPQLMDPPNITYREKDMRAWSERFHAALDQPAPAV